MYITVNSIKVDNPDQMAEMFSKSAPMLKKFEGFVGFELWKSKHELKAGSKWDSKENFENYINSDMFKQHHGGHGGQEMRNQAQVEYFDADTIV